MGSELLCVLGQLFAAILLGCVASIGTIDSTVKMGFHAKSFDLISLAVRIVVHLLLSYCPEGSTIAPWLTFALWVARRTSFAWTVLSLAIQCLGAIVGVGLVKLSLEVKVGAYKPLLGGGALQTVEILIVASSVLTFRMLSRNDIRSHHPILLLDVNPAINLAVGILNEDREAMDSMWILWVGTFTGATLGAILHKVLTKVGQYNYKKIFQVLVRVAPIPNLEGQLTVITEESFCEATHKKREAEQLADAGGGSLTS